MDKDSAMKVIHRLERLLREVREGTRHYHEIAVKSIMEESERENERR